MNTAHAHATSVLEHTVIWRKIRASGRSQKWFAQALGYAYSTYADGSKGTSFYAIADGRRVPGPRRRAQLARLLDCRVGDLWYLADESGRVEAVR